METPLSSMQLKTARPYGRRYVPLIGAALALVALAGCRPEQKAAAPDIRPVRYMKVEMFPGGETVSLTGTVQAQSEINLSFRIDGRVVERRVDVGARVKSGQLIAVLNPENEESGVAGARANVAAARAQLVEARNNYERHKELLAQNFISKARFDQVEATFRAAQSQVTAAQSQLDIASNRLGYTRLVADSPGTVTAVGAEPGEVVQAGRMIVQIASESGRDAVFGVPPRIKDVVPANPEVTVVTDLRSQDHRGRPRARGFSARRSRHRHVCCACRTDRPARRNAPGFNCDRSHQTRRRSRHQHPGLGADA